MAVSVRKKGCNASNKTLGKQSYAWFTFHYEIHTETHIHTHHFVTSMPRTDMPKFFFQAEHIIASTLGMHYSNRSLLLLQDDCGTISHEISLLFLKVLFSLQVSQV